MCILNKMLNSTSSIFKKHSDAEITRFLEISLSFVAKIPKKLEAVDGDST